MKYSVLFQGIFLYCPKILPIIYANQLLAIFLLWRFIKNVPENFAVDSIDLKIKDYSSYQHFF